VDLKLEEEFADTKGSIQIIMYVIVVQGKYNTVDQIENILADISPKYNTVDQIENILDDISPKYNTVDQIENIIADTSPK
jgi:acetolactate synthase small subunit